MFIHRSLFQLNMYICRHLKMSTVVIHSRRLQFYLPSTQFRNFGVDCNADVDEALKNNDHVDASDLDTENTIRTGVIVVQNFLNEEEENTLFKEVEPHLKRLRYEANHWDDVSDYSMPI